MTDKRPSSTGSGRVRSVKKGDLLVWHPPGHTSLAHEVFIEVNRVAKDGSWADIRCYTWAMSWTKRQPLPMPDVTLTGYWDRTTLDAQEVAWEARHAV